MKTNQLINGMIVFVFLVGLTGEAPASAQGDTQPGNSLLKDATLNGGSSGYWDSEFNLGVILSQQPNSSGVYAIEVCDNLVYVGGDFDLAGDVAANGIAAWNNSTHHWSALGSGISQRVSAILVNGDNVYAGGFFQNAGGITAHNIAKWNKSSETWSTLGSGMTKSGSNASVFALAITEVGDIIAAGDFDSAGGVSARNIARWDGSQWHAMGTGVGDANNSADALAVIGSNIYVGGEFITAGGSSAKHLAVWNVSSWSPVGGGTDNDVLALAAQGNSLYVGGSFTHVNTSTAVGHVALWTGITWNTLAGGVDAPDVDSLAVTPGGVFAGGRFTYLGDGVTPANRLAAWNGANWAAVGIAAYNLGGGVDSNLYAMAYSSSDDSLYMGGYFNNAGTYAANHVARRSLTDEAWYSLGNSVNGHINTLAAINNDIYVGGLFTSAGGIPASSIARWDKITRQWSLLGSGVTGCSGLLCRPIIYALDTMDNKLVVGGNFTHAGGIAAKNIAVWDSTTETWSALGDGLYGCTGMGCVTEASAILVKDNTIFAGGKFITAGSVTANNVAYYSNSDWHAMSAGTDDTTRALTPLSTSTLAGGDFLSPGTHLAYYTGSAWGGVAGINNTVNALHDFGFYLLVGGTFTNAAGSGANYIVMWNGASLWTPCSSGVNGPVYAIDTADLIYDAYVGGDFTTAGLGGANYIAEWNGSQWSSLGTGTDDIVRAVLIDGSYIYAGGYFKQAGGYSSFFLGRWTRGSKIFMPLISK